MPDTLANPDTVGIRADQHPSSSLSLFQEDRVYGSDCRTLGSEFVQVWDDCNFVRHCDGCAEELWRTREGEEGRDGVGFVEELGPVEGERVVDCLVEERGEGVADGVPEEVGDLVKVVVDVQLRPILNGAVCNQRRLGGWSGHGRGHGGSDGCHRYWRGQNTMRSKDGRREARRRDISIQANREDKKGR